jgi:hypothetical protein
VSECALIGKQPSIAFRTRWKPASPIMFGSSRSLWRRLEGRHENRKARVQRAFQILVLGRTQILAGVSKCDWVSRTMLAYYREIWTIVLGDAKAFWTAHKVATTLPSPLISLLAWTLLKRVPAWSDLMQIAIVCVVVFLASLSLTVLVSLCRAPKLLDDTLRTEIRRVLEKNTHVQASPERTPAEERHYNAARVALSELGQEAANLLRQLNSYGELTFTGNFASWLPNGMDQATTQSCLQRCAENGLVTLKSHMPTGGIYPTIIQTYAIAPAMKAALDELLYA